MDRDISAGQPGPTRTEREAHAIASRASASASAARLMQGLAWFGIAFGAVQLVAPRSVGRVAGRPGGGGTGLLRLAGLREVATGVGMMGSADKRPWLKGRLAGDAMDIALAARHFAMPRASKPRTFASVIALGAIALFDLHALHKDSQQKRQRKAGVFDYSDRSGFKRSADAMRGAALKPLQP